MKVSIYIPTHNRAKTLKRAIESALDQTYEDIEIIVCDDGSNDETQAMMQELVSKNPKIRYIRFDTPKGANAARNAAIHAATGELVTGLDDDDAMLPNRVENLFEVYDEQYAFVSSSYYFSSASKKRLKRLSRKTVITLDDLLYANIVGNQVLSSKKKFLACGLFDESLPAAQDIDMWIRLLEKYRIAYISPKPGLIVYDNPQGSITNSPRKFKGYFALYRKHRKKMNSNQRKYRLFGLALMRDRSFLYCARLIPWHPKYTFVAFVKLLVEKGLR